jgi:hypothetical protein
LNSQILATRAFVQRFEAPSRCGSWKRTLEVLAESMQTRHDGRTPPIEHARLGRRIGLSPRQAQRIVHALRAAGVLRIDAQRGFANVYRVLVDWVLRLIAGESVFPDAPPRTVELDARDARGAAPTRPPPIYGRWVNARGGCMHQSEACAECRAKQG